MFCDGPFDVREEGVNLHSSKILRGTGGRVAVPARREKLQRL